MYATPGAVAPLVFLHNQFTRGMHVRAGLGGGGRVLPTSYLFENRYMSTLGHRRPACVTSGSTHGGRAGSCARWNMPMYVFVFVYACTCMNMDIYENIDMDIYIVSCSGGVRV